MALTGQCEILQADRLIQKILESKRGPWGTWKTDGYIPKGIFHCLFAHSLLSMYLFRGETDHE